MLQIKHRADQLTKDRRVCILDVQNKTMADTTFENIVRWINTGQGDYLQEILLKSERNKFKKLYEQKLTQYGFKVFYSLNNIYISAKQ